MVHGKCFEAKMIVFGLCWDQFQHFLDGISSDEESEDSNNSLSQSSENNLSEFDDIYMGPNFIRQHFGHLNVPKSSSLSPLFIYFFKTMDLFDSVSLKHIQQQ